MRFTSALSLFVVSTSAAPTVLETFVAKPTESQAVGLETLEAEDGLTSADYETQLESLDSCDSETEANCQVYSLVMLDDGETALVNLGFWNELKDGFSSMVHVAANDVKKAAELVKSSVPVVKKTSKKVSTWLHKIAPLA